MTSPILKLPNKPKVKKKIATKYPIPTEIFPLARGLFFFLGCRLSESLSIMSLNTYIDEEINEKDIKSQSL